MPDEEFTGPGPIYRGKNGTDGGNIELWAPQGTVRFAGGQIKLGKGGDGANVEASEVDTDETQVEIIGGNGGDSGRLTIDSPNIEGVPTLEVEWGGDIFVLGGFGVGGRGGSVLWDNGQSAKIYKNLIRIVVRGGNGGNGSAKGGDSGDAFYFSDRVINEIGKPVATAEAISGEGGGEAIARGGDGGDVRADVQAAHASGGAGGSLAPDPEIPDNWFDLSLIAVISGNGGNGMDGCDSDDPAAGGNGGDSGSVTARGGRGGNALASSPDNGGGNGGHIGKVWRGTPGNGGNGDPPGNGGELGGTRVASVGPVGDGGTDALPGEDLGQPEPADAQRGMDGVACDDDDDGGGGGGGARAAIPPSWRQYSPRGEWPQLPSELTRRQPFFRRASQALIIGRC